MKHLRVLSTLAMLAITGYTANVLAQDTALVRISPNSDSAIIGQLESPSLAVDASWPDGAEPIPGWRPIYYRGEFLVYVDSQDVGKNFLPLPGSKYLLSPSREAQILAIATEDDKAEIISIDPRYCHVNLETIVRGYIEDDTFITPSPQETSAAPPLENVETKPAIAKTQYQNLEGIIVSTNYFESQNTGYEFKLINTDNETMAYIDDTNLFSIGPIQEYINSRLVATGSIEKPEESSFVVMNLVRLKKKI